MKTDYIIIAAVAIIAIAIVETVAIVYQVDGRILALAIAAIAGIGGYEIGIHLKK